MDKISWLSDLCLLEITFINTYVAEKALYPMWNMGRKHHGFLYTVKGSETYIFDNKAIKATPNSVLYIPKGKSYKIELEDEVSKVIALDFEMDGNLSEPFITKYNNEGSVYDCFFDAEKQWKRTNFGYKTSCKAVFYKIVYNLIKHEDTYSNNQYYKILLPSLDYMKKHYLENDFRVEKLYQISKISPKYYEIIFKRFFNMSPKEYVMRLKIKLAKNLLLSEKTTVGDIALRLGYKDMYNFSKTFKKKTGYSPSEYKKLYISQN